MAQVIESAGHSTPGHDLDEVGSFAHFVTHRNHTLDRPIAEPANPGFVTGAAPSRRVIVLVSSSLVPVSTCLGQSVSCNDESGPDDEPLGDSILQRAVRAPTVPDGSESPCQHLSHYVGRAKVVHRLRYVLVCVLEPLLSGGGRDVHMCIDEPWAEEKAVQVHHDDIVVIVERRTMLGD